MHTIHYSDGTAVIELKVPWGHGTGKIPPPKIEFMDSETKEVRTFYYQGEK